MRSVVVSTVSPLLEVAHAASFCGRRRINRFRGWPLRLDKEHGLYPPEVRETSQVRDSLCVAMRREIGSPNLGKTTAVHCVYLPHPINAKG